MALDNVEITPGSGKKVATDELSGGEHAQYMKLMSGTDGSEEKLGGDAANGLDVDVTRLPAVTVASGGIASGGVASGAIVDGADVTQGATTDAAVDTDTTGTLSGKLRGLVKLMVNLLSRWPAALGGQGGLKVEGVASGTPVPVSGTFYQATQPVSAAALPLPSGASTSALQGGGLPAALAANGGLKVEGVAGGVAQPISAAALPLPSGAATSALQGGGLPAALAANGGLKVEGVAGGVAQPISAASLPLPSGAATSALQGGGLPAALAANGGLKVEGVAGGVAQPMSSTQLPAALAANGGMKVEGVAGGVAQPVSIADGADAAQGATTDAAVAAGAAGSVSAKLRRLTTDLGALLTELQGKADLAETQPVSLATLPPVNETMQTLQVTLTVTNGAYDVADVVGGLITFTNAASANGKTLMIEKVTLAGVVAVPYTLHFFSADIATPRLDGAVFGLAAADGQIWLGSLDILSTDYRPAQTAFYNAVVPSGRGFPVKCGASVRHIYAYLVATATTSPGTTTLYLTVTFRQLD